MRAGLPEALREALRSRPLSEQDSGGLGRGLGIEIFKAPRAGSNCVARVESQGVRSFKSHNPPVKWVLLSPFFIAEETETERLRSLHKVLLLEGSRAGI